MRREFAKTLFTSVQQIPMGLVIKDGMGAGRLTMKYEEIDSAAEREKVQSLALFAGRHEMTLAELALRYVLSAFQVSTVIIGTKKIDHLLANITASDRGPLPDEVSAELLTLVGTL
jgi:aryl-alcohol dehydrogenase-like predicted oxidoreductase